MRGVVPPIALALLTLLGCERSRESPSPPAGKAPAASPRVERLQRPPPAAAFVAPEPWKPRGEGEAVPAPDLSQEAWRALVNQYSPHQKKTPQWQPLPATKTVELQMPPGSRYRCVVHPIEVAANSNDFNTKLNSWELTRKFVCSSDGFTSWSEHGLRVRLHRDGEREVRFQSDVQLRERHDGVTRETRVVLRSEPERREATTGPPQVLAGVEVDED